jgi:hypothetical protein
MRVAIQSLSWAIWFPLDVLVIAALLRGPYRRFPFVFAYSVAVFFTSVVEVAAYPGYFPGTQFAHTWVRYYWIDETIRQGLLFAIVISLVYLATAAVQARAVVRVFLIAAAALFAAISFFVHYDSHAVMGRWMTLWTRDLSFSSALLDFALWSILLTNRKHDEQLLMLSGGLGIQFAGEAIGQTLRNQFPSMVLAGNVIIIAASLACPLVWWHVFRTSPVGKASVPASSPHL